MSQSVSVTVKPVLRDGLHIRLQGLANALPNDGHRAALLERAAHELEEKGLVKTSEVIDDGLMVTYNAADGNYHSGLVHDQVVATCKGSGVPAV